MSELPADSSAPGTNPREARLDSWKEIAAYLRRDVSTVQRWEKREAMPVHRHLHDKQGSVYALRTELDAWSQSRKAQAAPDGTMIASAPRIPELASNGGSPHPTSNPGAGSRALPPSATGILASVSGWWRRTATSGGNPIADAEFAPVTDLDGAPHGAAISHDGKFVAFLSDRDGATDVWITQLGAGRFYNLTRGAAVDVVNHDIRNLSFSPDDTLVLFWARTADGGTGRRVGIWSVPTLGGQPRPYLDDVAEMDWSATGRLVYHTAEPGDPMFVAKAGQPLPGVRIYEASPGAHAHFLAWSPDESFIYFVGGTPPDELDLWRIRPSGGTPERLTSHHSRVAHPVFVNRRTLLYLATDTEGGGPWLHALDVARRVSQRIGSRVDPYTSLAASGDRRRLVATRANPKSDLLRTDLSHAPASISGVTRMRLPTSSGRSPRFGSRCVLYVASVGTSDSLWRVADGASAELWSAPRDMRIIGGPAVSPDGERIAIAANDRGRSRLYVMNADGTQARVVAGSLAPRGAPAWAPDGRTLLVSLGDHGDSPRVHRVPLDGRPPQPLVAEYSVDPVSAPDGSFIVYSGPDIGTTFHLKAATPAGAPHRLPNLVLTRGARRIVFVPDRLALVILKGEMRDKDLWMIDLETGRERPLTSFGRDIVIRDFDVSPDGRELVVEQVQERSDIVRIDLAGR